MNATPVFYFLLWVFRWGSIQLWPIWGCIWSGVLLVSSCQLEQTFQSLSSCSFVFFCFFEISLAFCVPIGSFIKLNFNSEILTKLDLMLIYWLWTARERLNESIFHLARFYSRWGCIFSIAVFAWGYISFSWGEVTFKRMRISFSTRLQ